MDGEQDGFSRQAHLIDRFLRELSGDDYVRRIPVTLAHFCFRNGPVEDMHAEGKLSQEDMKILNKYLVDRMGLLVFLFGLADFDRIKMATHFDAQCGSDWDDPDIDRLLKEFRISPERVSVLEKLREEGSAIAECPEQGSRGLSFLAKTFSDDHAPDEQLKSCPMCGSNILIRDARTNLSSMLRHRRGIGTNKALAKAAGVSAQLVTDMQFFDRAHGMRGKRGALMECVAEVLEFPLDSVLDFDPGASSIRCDDCNTSAPWFVWNSRKA